MHFMKDSKITRMAAAINAGPKILAVGEERFSVELRGEDWFAGAEAVWADLVGNSNADGLFLSWDWQSTWWHKFGPALYAKPAIIVVTSEAGLVVGVAPFLTPTPGGRSRRFRSHRSAMSGG